MVKNNKLFLTSHTLDRIRIGRIRTFPFSFDFPHDSVAYMHVLVKTRSWESETETNGKPNYNACSNALQKYWLSSSASAWRLHSFTTLEDWRLWSHKWNQNAVLLDQNALYFWLVQWVDNTIHGINLYPVDSTIGFPSTYPPDSDFIQWIAVFNIWTNGTLIWLWLYWKPALGKTLSNTVANWMLRK